MRSLLRRSFVVVMLDVCHVPSPVSSHLCFLGVGHPLAAFLLYRFSFLEDPSM